MKGVMVDLETMGTKPYSAIVAVGAVVFDTRAQEITKEFYANINLEDCLNHGLRVNGNTVSWWMSQSEQARNALTSQQALPLDYVLREFATLFHLYPDTEVWGNGADFDNVLLAGAYEYAAIPTPWKWNKNRCYRTIKNLAPDIKVQRVGTHHNALDDARSQAVHLMKILGRYSVE